MKFVQHFSMTLYIQCSINDFILYFIEISVLSSYSRFYTIYVLSHQNEKMRSSSYTASVLLYVCVSISFELAAKILTDT